MVSFGYHPRTAEAIKNRVDRDMAQVEDAAYSMVRRVPDHNLTRELDTLLEEMREIAYKLHELVDRRTIASR